MHAPRSYTRDEAQDLIERASSFLEYGPDYDRNIHSAAADLLDALAHGRSFDSWAMILELRLDSKKAR